MSLFGSLFQVAATAVGFYFGGPAGAAAGAALGSIPNSQEAKRDAKDVRNTKVAELNLQRSREQAALSRQLRARRASAINNGGAFGTLGSSGTAAITPIFQSQFTRENDYLNTGTDLAIGQAYKEARGEINKSYSGIVTSAVSGFSLGTSINGAASSSTSLSGDITKSLNNPANAGIF